MHVRGAAIEAVKNSFLLREADATRGEPTDKLKPYTLSESGSGATRDRTYGRSAVIFWPASHHLQLMLVWGEKEYEVAKLEAVIDASETLPYGVECTKAWCEALLQHLQRDPASQFGDFSYRRMRYVKVGARAGAEVQLLLELLQGVDIVDIYDGTAYRGAEESADFLETLKALEKRGELKCVVPYLRSSFEASGREHRGRVILSSAQSIMEACPALEVVQPAVHAAAVRAYKRTASILSWSEVVEAMKNIRGIGGTEDDVLGIMKAVRMFSMAAEHLQVVLEAAAAALGSYTSLIPIVGRYFKSVDAPALRVLEKLTDVTRGLDALAQLNEEIADHLVDRFMKSNGYAVDETDLVDFYVGLLVAGTDTAALTLIDRVIGAGPRRFNPHYLLYVMQLLQDHQKRAAYPGLDRLVLHTISPYVMSSSPGALKVKVSWLVALIWAAEKAQLPAEVMAICLTTLDTCDPFTDESRRALELLPKHAPSVKSHPEFGRLIRRAIDKLRTAAEPKESFASDYQSPCKCGDCNDLNTFLRSSTARYHEFHSAGAGTNRRQHIFARVECYEGEIQLSLKRHTASVSVQKFLTGQAQQELKERRSHYANRQSYIQKLEEVLHSLPSSVDASSPAGSASAPTTSAASAACC